MLAWAQYGCSISLFLNYVVRTRGPRWLTCFLYALFEAAWVMTMWSLVVCVARGPGFVNETGDAEAGRRLEGYANQEVDEDGYTDDQAEVHAPLLARGDTSTSTSSLPPYPIRSRSHSPTERSQPRLDEDRRPVGDLDFITALNSVPPTPEMGADSWMCKSDGSRRYCRKCQTFKPDRAHHCSSCGKCVIKVRPILTFHPSTDLCVQRQMDHHCPWLGGRCVGVRNHKAFLLFIAYGTLTALAAAVLAAGGLSDFVNSSAIKDGFELAPLNWAFLVLVGGLFGLTLGGFTVYHFWLVSVNRTTIENMERSLRVRPVGSGRDNSAPYALLRPHHRAPAGAFPPPQQPLTGQPRPNEVLPRYSLPVYKSDDVLSRQERRKLESAATKLNLYDLGNAKQNWREVMGRESKWWEWAIPTQPRGWAL